jgi:hypothetical protein
MDTQELADMIAISPAMQMWLNKLIKEEFAKLAEEKNSEFEQLAWLEEQGYNVDTIMEKLGA